MHNEVTKMPFFRCFASYKGATITDQQTQTKSYYHKYLDHTEQSARGFKGVYIYIICPLEKLFKLNIVVYKLKENEATWSAVPTFDMEKLFLSQLTSRPFQLYQRL